MNHDLLCTTSIPSHLCHFRATFRVIGLVTIKIVDSIPPTDDISQLRPTHIYFEGTLQVVQ